MKQLGHPINSQTQMTKLLPLSLWFGLAIGLLEVGILSGKKFIFHQRIWQPLDFVWMTPLANIVLFGALGLLLVIVRQRFPNIIRDRFVSWFYIFLGCLSVQTLSSKLHAFAWLLLALGCATQLSRIFEAYPKKVNTFIRSTIPVMSLIVIALAIGVRGNEGFGQDQVRAEMKSNLKEKPNIIIITMDTVRAESLSVYGEARKTSPVLEGLAKKGVVFNQAYSTSPWTLPSHGTMFTGLYPNQLGTDWVRPIDQSHLTLAEVLSQHGYQTSGFVGNLFYATYETGLSKGFSHYEDYPVSVGTIIRASWLTRKIEDMIVRMLGGSHKNNYVTGEKLNQNFFHWLDQNQHSTFFSFINYMDAHFPYIPPFPFKEKFGSGEVRPDRGDDDERVKDWSPREHQIELDAYESSIAYVDDQIGKLIQGLKERGRLENTLLIITSDHGEQFGEHGLIDHANSLYKPVLHIPLLIIFPGHVPEDVRIDISVSLRDIPATIVELIQLKETRLPGMSLASHWKMKARGKIRTSIPLAEVKKGINRPEWFPISKGDMRAIIFDGHHYILNGDGHEELYNFERDPKETQNLLELEEGYQQKAEVYRNFLKQNNYEGLEVGMN